MSIRKLILFFGCCLVLFGCKDQMICAAFQSTYILDQQKQAAFFSMFEQDSTPRYYKGVPNSRNGIGQSYPDWIIKNRWKRIKMENVYRDTTLTDSAAYNSLIVQQVDFGTDSLSSDSTRMAMNNPQDTTGQEKDPFETTGRFHYNADMVNYMVLVGNDVMKAQAKRREDRLNGGAQDSTATASAADTTTNQKKSLFGRVFNKSKNEGKEKKVVKGSVDVKNPPAQKSDSTQEGSGGF